MSMLYLVALFNNYVDVIFAIAITGYNNSFFRSQLYRYIQA